MVQIETLCETTADGRKKFHGECFYAGVLFKFSGCELKSEKYFAKVTVRIISPDTGKTLQVAGKQRRAIMERLNEHEKQALEAGKQVEKLNASTEVYLPLDDLGDIEKRINDAVFARHRQIDMTEHGAVTDNVKFTEAVIVCDIVGFIVKPFALEAAFYKIALVPLAGKANSCIIPVDNCGGCKIYVLFKGFYGLLH